ncbi:hypothetical protein D3C85_1088740 [compost metagenome]
MNTIDGRNGNRVAIIPGRSDTWATEPSDGARTTVFSSSYWAMFSCACRSSVRAVVMSRSRRVPTPRLSSSLARYRSAWAETSCALSDLTRFSNGTGSMRNNTSPFFSGRLSCTGTSMTGPVTTGTTGVETKYERATSE